jgi:hypothetical protein
VVRRFLAGLVVALAVLTAAPVLDARERAAPDGCRGFGPGSEVGTVAEPGLVELSGLVAGRAHPEVLWAHNDSGGAPEVFALSATGAALGRYAIEGAEATDWEDIGIGPGPEEGTSYLYLADIGDNGSTREHVTVYRVVEPEAEPDGSGGSLPLVDALTIRYPDGPSDAESLFVDPLDGDLYVITKALSGMSRVLRATAEDVAAGGDITMEDVGGFQASNLADIGSGEGLPATMVTGADISPDGSVVLVRTYQDVLVFERPAGRLLPEAFEEEPCSAPSLAEAQGEAIAVAADGASYTTISEGEGPPVHQFEIDPPRVDTATTEPTTSTTVVAPDEEPASEDESGDFSILLVIGFLAVAGVVLFVVVRRQSRRNR